MFYSILALSLFIFNIYISVYSTVFLFMNTFDIYFWFDLNSISTFNKMWHIICCSVNDMEEFWVFLLVSPLLLVYWAFILYMFSHTSFTQSAV